MYYSLEMVILFLEYNTIAINKREIQYFSYFGHTNYLYLPTFRRAHAGSQCLHSIEYIYFLNIIFLSSTVQNVCLVMKTTY